MLSREQIYILLILRKRENNIFFNFPCDLIRHISDFNNNPDSDINVALRLAASGLEDDMSELVKMIKANPRLLLQAGNVITRGSVPIIRTTLYEFFLGEGDPVAAKQIEFGFAEIPNGENQRIRQYERYRPHIEALTKQLELGQPTFDLESLFKLIKTSSPEDIQAALNNDMNHKSLLRDALCTFRDAVKPKRKTIGMHYAHYSTLLQALGLLYREWEKLSNNDTNYDKCDLVWQQIIGLLQLSLPTIDRVAFATAFRDNKRTLNFRYENGSFPDTYSNEAIYGERIAQCRSKFVWWKPPSRLFMGAHRRILADLFAEHLSNKLLRLAKLMQPHHSKTHKCVIA